MAQTARRATTSCASSPKTPIAPASATSRKAFSLKGEDRVWLKDTLRDLAGRGPAGKEPQAAGPARQPAPCRGARHLLARSRRRPAGSSDRTGKRRQRAESAGCGETFTRRERTGARCRRPCAGQGVSDRRSDRPRLHGAGDEDIRQAQRRPCSACLRVAQDGTFRIEPVERRQPELVDRAGIPQWRQARRPGRGRTARAPAATACRARKVLTVVGSLTSEKAVSMIAIHAHDIPHIFPARGASRRPKR